jgi:hypothetical protein
VRWSLQVVIAEPIISAEESMSSDGSSGVSAGERPTCGLDIGWRRMDDGGIRIAKWIGSDGAEGELRIPADVVARDGKSDSIRSIRDVDRDIWQGRLRDLRTSLSEGHWMRQRLAAVHAWKRMGRYVALHREWTSARWPGDDDLYNRMTTWLRHDRHLWSWEAHNRRRQSLQVQGRVRQCAVELVRRYGTISIERAGLVPALVRRREDHDEDDRIQRRLNAKRMHAVSPALLRRELAWLARTYGAEVLEQDPAYTTRTCADCGHRRDEVEDWAPLEIVCAACAVVEDQDRTAARNRLALAPAPVPPASGEPLAAASGENGGRVRRALPPRRTRRRAVAAPLAGGVVSDGDHAENA